MSDKINWVLFKFKTLQIQDYIPKSQSGLKDPEIKSSSDNTKIIIIIITTTLDKIKKIHF